MNEEDLISTAELIAWGAGLMMTILIAVTGWLYRRLVKVDDTQSLDIAAQKVDLYREVNKIKTELHDIRLHVAEKYVPREELGERLKGIEDKLDQLLINK